MFLQQHVMATFKYHNKIVFVQYELIKSNNYFTYKKIANTGDLYIYSFISIYTIGIIHEFLFMPYGNIAK